MLFRHKHGALQSALYGRGAESPRFWKTGYTLRSGIGSDSAWYFRIFPPRFWKTGYTLRNGIGSGSAWYVDNFPLEENGRGPGVYTAAPINGNTVNLVFGNQKSWYSVITNMTNLVFGHQKSHSTLALLNLPIDDTLMRLLEKRTEIENEIVKMYNTEKAE